MAARTERAPRSTLYIAYVVALYWSISITLVFSNKFLISSDDSIPAPLFITWLQCLCTVAIIAGLGYWAAADGAPAVLKGLDIPAPAYNPEIAKSIMSLSCIFVGMVTFNNLCLQYVEVSFYNVARSLTIVCNVIFTFILLRQTTSFRTILCLAIVVAGFFVGADGEVNFSFLGTVFGVMSSCFVSLNGIYQKKALDMLNGLFHTAGDGPVEVRRKREENHWRLTFYNNMNACFMFPVLILLSGEVSTLWKYSDILFSIHFWGVMLFSGFLGFAIGIAIVMQISATSPLTHNISGTAKACVQTVLALWWYANPTTITAMFGVFLVIMGSGLYAYVRYLEKIAGEALPAKHTGKPCDEFTSSDVEMLSKTPRP